MRSGRVAVIAAAGSLISFCGARAADYNWTGPNNGQWPDAANWAPTGGPPGPTDTAVFEKPGVGSYTVVFPGASGDDRVGSLQVVGDQFAIEALRPIRVTGTAPDAVHIRAAAGAPANLRIDGSLEVPNGGITLSGKTADTFVFFAGSSVSADTLTILGGGTFKIKVTRDVEVGNPGAPRGSTAVAQYSGGTAGGVLRVHPDGLLIGGTNAAGGVYNDGTVYGGFMDGGLINSGQFIAGNTFSPPEPRAAGVHGDFVQTADGVLRERVQRNSPGGAVMSHAGGRIDIAGTVVVDPIDPYAVRVGDRFYLISTSEPMNFSASLTASYGGFTFEPQVVPGEGLYALTTVVPEPAYALAAFGLLGVFVCRRGR